MGKPAVFFDRDNTLILSDGYLGDPSQVQLMPDAAEAVARAKKLGFVVLTCSNQSGVARGLFTEADVIAVNRRMDQLLLEANPEAIIDRHEFCLFHPQAPLAQYRVDSDLRKPRPGMLRHAAKDMGLDLSRSWMVGDAPRDIEAGIAAGCKTILIVHDTAVPLSPAAKEESRVKPDFIVANLSEAIDAIAANTAATPSPGTPGEGGGEG